MMLPEGVLNARGNPAFGNVLLRGSNNKPLREYDIMNEGVHTSCLVLTSPGDIITVQFVLEHKLTDLVDLVVDGIRRDCAIISKSEKCFTRYFRKVCHQSWDKNGRRGGLKSCAMEIVNRDAEKDVAWKGDGSPSFVGTLEVQLFSIKDVASQTRYLSSQGNVLEDALDTVKRAPTFTEYASWDELNPSIDLSRAPPSFEIRFTDKHQLDKYKVDRVLKEWPCKLMASFKFKFCSTADLLALGYKDVPTYFPREPMLASGGEMSPSPDTPVESSSSKTIGDDNYSLFVEDPDAELESKPSLTTDNPFEPKGEVSPQPPNIMSVPPFLKPSKKEYSPSGFGTAGNDIVSEPFPKAEPSSYHPQSTYYDPSHQGQATYGDYVPYHQDQATYGYYDAAHLGSMDRHDLRDRTMELPQSFSSTNGPSWTTSSPPSLAPHGNSSWAPLSRLSQEFRDNPYNRTEYILDPTATDAPSQFSGFARRQQAYNSYNKSQDSLERLEALDQENGPSRFTESSCQKKSLTTNSLLPSASKSAGIEPKFSPTPTPEFRKANSINDDMPNTCEGPQNRSISPMRRSLVVAEQVLIAARTRLAVAEKRKAHLSEAFENAMHSNKVRKLNQVAEQVENENLELQAKLDALYSNRE